ncbi:MULTISPECIES: 30S ribosomal protein S12 methylthiotransferase RimO [Paraclostridium]|jgi:ribosomal protein S12 methylthiotransferase|uniref:Ribosomal protein uS12 methylthiotransferase RimO n=3 Tax=Paraclostridium bifermentans TaxID=1490 RepID=A0A5P3XDU5_PARBF|nr:MULTISPECIES: 30S ribosomal protein S12 methylthiotransferase RimO [Paraclostridium]KGJ50668.1 ribosomal protein S12 methylthiotransferase [Clostridium sp. NCR]MDV8116152.1 30S ribosomal protein S12 methylthiotransferase RimO [Bacillus sp. BAU-SS-2023]RDC50166.1 30S ribosomal protein S12 methylthiotransferase RimO [Acinetobacter sp. RIT592]MBN8046524.1 30S ribosomal protein S12 methylthiotransferase RimO [Paraclostridium bifermentans]MBZ6004935.1 30S ribosomal protein S12 methylthiotransfer
MLKIALESLGCSKNLVDAEIMMGILNRKGYKLVGEFEEADIILVNTCGFIESAKQESIDTILDLAQLKENGNLKLLIVTGCLAQRYAKELQAEIPEIDAIVGTGSYQQIDEIIANLEKENNIVSLNDIEFAYNEDLPRYVTTPEYMAYLKIGEGCDNHCTYCIIPKLRGRYRSRKMEDIIKEAKDLASKGVKELVVIAQDTTKYGLDLYGEVKLPQLLEELAQIDGIKWIRIMYSYPESITEELVKVIKKYDNICNYFDMPIQHASNKVLKLMNRHTTKEDIKSKVEMIRKYIPDATLRTTIIVGFPGETDEDFNELVEFAKDMKFDRLGAFAYSREEDTPADKLPNHLDEDVKLQRRDQLMLVQQEISQNLNAQKIDNEYEVLIEEQIEDKVYIGRTQGDAEEIDSIVYVKSENQLEIGSFVKVKINNALEYDLMGDVVNELA